MDSHIIQKIMDVIDSRITEKISLGELAEETGYSASHLGRTFSAVTGIAVTEYITRRKLQCALFDLGCGEKILDAALKYGFETHSGFTKAFKRHFGYPPSIYRIHAVTVRPDRMDINRLKTIISGGDIVKSAIIELQPFKVVGFTSRHRIPDVRHTNDIPYYVESSNMNYRDPLTRLHDLFDNSRHCEYTVCFDVDPDIDEFTYLLGVGVDNPEDYGKIEPDMYEMTMPGGLYARFTTPLVEESRYGQAIANLWKTAFDNWLPSSVYVFDESRYDFEYYDERDHFYHKDGLRRQQMDIYIPVSKR